MKSAAIPYENWYRYRNAVSDVDENFCCMDGFTGVWCAPAHGLAITSVVRMWIIRPPVFRASLSGRQ